ncbi:DUF4114 domain-containing protein [Reyranella sp.]|uniref:DUF4114 domain-containing protein n=1 Tax=Reyranella sp. TaxID=1929291 RepID=UPI003BAA64AA
MEEEDDNEPQTYFPSVFNTAKGGLFGGFFDGASVTDPNVAALIMDYRWTTSYLGATAATTIKYFFPTSAADYQIFPSPNSVDPVSHVPVTDIQKAAVLASLGLIESYTQLTFVQAASGTAADATLRFAQTTSGNGGSHARFPSNDGPYSKSDSRDAGDNFLGTNGDPPGQFFGTDQFNTIMHELGHSIGLKHGHDTSLHGALAPQYNDNEFSVMTYASWLGSPGVDVAPTEAIAGSSPQSYMMFDIAALQELYGANFGKLGIKAVYTWDTVTGQQLIDGSAAPNIGASSTSKIFSTVWTQGALAFFDLSAFTQDQVDDLRPGHWLKFDDTKIAELNSLAAPGDPDYYLAQGNVYNALLHHGDLRSAIVGLTTGIGNDTLIGNDRDNVLNGGAGDDIVVTAGGNDTVSGGAGADTFHFGGGHSTLRDTLADLNGDTVREFGFGAVDVLGARLGWDSVSVTAGQTTISSGGSTVTLDGGFAGNGVFLLSARGSGADAHTGLSYVNYLPTLAEGVAVDTASINGLAAQPFLSGDGAVRFTLDLKSAVSAFANSLGYYKIAADGTISDVHILFANTLDVAAGARTVDLGVPASGEHIGFFLIQDGFRAYGNLADDLLFLAPGTNQAATTNSGLAILSSASAGALTTAQIFHSSAGLNPDGATQVLSGVQAGGLELQVGFEDLPTATGDRDFQDVVIAIHVNGDGFLFT